MRTVAPLKPEDAPEKSWELLDGIIGRHGSTGDMVATMAHSPALLQGYLDFSHTLKRVKLPRQSARRSHSRPRAGSAAAPAWQHTKPPRGRPGLSDTDIALAREATATEPREAALLTFAVRVLVEPASITADDITELRDHGWNDRTIADVVGLVNLNLVTGSFNLVAGIKPEED